MSYTARSGSTHLWRSRRRVAAIVALGVILGFAQGSGGAVSTALASGTTAADETPEPRSFDELTLAAEKAADTGTRQELESARDAASTTYINPDGSSTVEITETPTRVRQDGEWVDIDPRLSIEDGVLIPEATKADVEISDGRGTEPLATVSKGTRSISLDWTSDLPPAEVEDSTATFDAGGSRDVEVTATNDGFNLRVILDKVPSAAPVYRLPLTTAGVRLYGTEDGGFAANDSAGKTVFRIAPPLMWDATQDALEDGPEFVKPVDASVENGEGGAQTLVLRPDFAWLSDPARVLPITIDPDTYVDNQGQKSTYISSLNPSTSFGTAAMVRTGYDPDRGKARGYLHFPMPVRTGGVVTSAKLKLYQTFSNTCNATNLSIYPITSSWTTAMTWNGTTGASKQPTYDAASPFKAVEKMAHGFNTSCPNASHVVDVEIPHFRGGMSYEE